MTKQAARKHKECIIWFIQNPEKGVWRKDTPTNDWYFDREPSFYENFFYIPNDEYIKFRKAEVEGETIQYEDSNGNLHDKGSMIFQYPVNRYYIKTEPEFQIGDWITELSINKKQVLTKDLSRSIKYLKLENEYKLWKPRSNEFCIFWNTDMKSYRISKFDQIAFGKGRASQYRDMQGNYYTNMAPLEFAMTLKDK